MRRTLTRITLLACALIPTACVTQAPLQGNRVAVELDKGSIGFFTLHVANEYCPSYQLILQQGFISETHDGKEETHVVSLMPPNPIEIVPKTSMDYLVSFQLPPGEYVVERLSAIAAGFLIVGHFDLQLNAKVTLPERRVVYLGHLDAKVVKRARDDQPRAGPVVPLIDQAVVGATDGTFELRFEDRFDADVDLVKQRYGVSSSADVLNETLPTPAAAAAGPAP